MFAVLMMQSPQARLPYATLRQLVYQALGNESPALLNLRNLAAYPFGRPRPNETC
jgi:hypothetical protein